MNFERVVRNKRILMLVGSAILMLSLTHCSFDKPSAPSWDVNVTVPLINKTYTMNKIANDEDVISADSSGLLRFDENVKIDKYFVNDELNLDSKHKSFNQSIGDISIDSPGSKQTHVELREIFTQADNLNGQTITVDPFSFTTAPKILEPYDNFSYVVIKSGIVEIIIENQMAIPLGSPIAIEIWDVNSGKIISTTSYNNEIDPGKTASFDINLAGKRITNRLSIRMSAGSPGSSGNPVFINANDSFTMTANIGDLKVNEAMAEIPAQTVSEENFIDIADSLIVQEARVQTGQVQISLNGNIPVNAWVRYELPDFQTPQGNVLADSFLVANNSFINKTIELSGLILRPQLADFGQQRLRFNWTIRTVDTGSNMVVIRSSDNMIANVDVAKTIFSQITGKLGNQTVQISQDDIDLNLPADIDSIFFETASMELNINNGINFPAYLALNIEGRNSNGGSSNLTVNHLLLPATAAGQPVTTTIVLDQNNSNIKEFISIVPSFIKVTGNVKLNNPDWIGTITRNDFVDGDVSIKAPITVKIPDQTVETDVQRIDIEQSVRDDIINNLTKGMFYIELKNHLPVGATIELLFCDRDSGLYQQPVLEIGPIGANAGQVDGSGYVVTADESQITLELSEKQVQTFLFNPLYSGVRIRLDGTNSQFVRVRASDYLQVKSYGKIKAKIN